MTWSLSDGGALPTSIGLDALERAIHYFQYAEGMLRRTLARTFLEVQAYSADLSSFVTASPLMALWGWTWSRV